MTAKEAKQRLERIWKAYTSAYDTVSIEDLMAFDMANNALGAIEQIQWERDMAIKQLHDMGYGLGEKPRDGDTISRKALCEYALNQKNKSVTPNDIMRFPSAQIDVPDTNVGKIPHTKSEIMQ